MKKNKQRVTVELHGEQTGIWIITVHDSNNDFILKSFIGQSVIVYNNGKRNTFKVERTVPSITLTGLRLNSKEFEKLKSNCSHIESVSV